MLVQMLNGFVHDDIAIVKEELEEYVKVRWETRAQQSVATMLLTWLVQTDHMVRILSTGCVSLLLVVRIVEEG